MKKSNINQSNNEKNPGFSPGHEWDGLYYNVLELEKELKWLERCIEHRIKVTFSLDEEEKAAGFPQPPELDPALSAYAKVVRELGLSVPGRLIIILALAPLLKPEALDIFFTRNKNFDREYTEFGGIILSDIKRFSPSLQTAVFILAGDDIPSRVMALDWFLPESPVIKHKILNIDPVPMGKVLLDMPLCITKDYLNYFIRGAVYSPAAENDFPARQMTTKLDWEDLVFPAKTLRELETIRDWQEHGHTLLRDPVLGKHARPGYRVLFCGAPGTGKSLTTALLGKICNVPVYRIDLSMVVSKFIGETEKNLSRVFAGAEGKGWILFFDEADALFARRSAVSNSNDRFANQETSYLLQRIEEYHGLVILATNFVENIDPAFSRRFDSTIFFPLPKYPERLELWRRIFSPHIPLAPGTDLEGIAREYRLSGGSITNIAMSVSLGAIKNNKSVIHETDVREGIRRHLVKTGSNLEILDPDYLLQLRNYLFSTKTAIEE